MFCVPDTLTARKQNSYAISLNFPVTSRVNLICHFKIKMISIVYRADPFAHTWIRKIIYQHSLYVIAARNYVYAKKKIRQKGNLRVRFFGMIRIRISDPRSFGSW